MSAGAARIRQLTELGRWDEVIAAVTAQLAEEPGATYLLGYLAQAQIALDQPEVAALTAERFVAAEPGREWAHRLLALALGKQGRAREAAAAAREAVRIAPHEPQAHIMLALQDADLKELRTEAGLAAAEALRLAPDNADAHFAAGYVAHKRGRRAAARAEYEQALAIEPDHSTALNNLAILQRGTRRTVDGLVSTLRADPQHETAQLNLIIQLGRLSYALLVGAAAALFVLAALSEHHASPTAGTVVVAIGFVVWAAATAFVMLRKLPSAAWSMLIRRHGIRPQVGLNLALLAVASLLVLLAGLTPAGHTLAPHTAPLLLYVAVGWTVRRLIRRFRG